MTYLEFIKNNPLQSEDASDEQQWKEYEEFIMQNKCKTKGASHDKQ